MAGKAAPVRPDAVQEPVDNRTWPEVVAGGIALVAIIAGLVVLWHLRLFALLVFAAVLVAVLLDAAAQGLRWVLPVGQSVAVGLAILLLAGALAFVGLVLGTQIVAELAELAAQLPAAIRGFEAWIDVGRVEAWVAERMQEALAAGTVISGLSGVTSVLAGAAGGVVLAVAGGIYLAMDPAGYRDRAVLLLPPSVRLRARMTADATGGALRAWLLGQLAAMAAVGLATTLGLWALGVPTAIALGIIAGLLEFVPYVGPILSALPALAVAFVDSPVTALWVLLLYLAIQQVEGTLLIPLIQQGAVDLPPAVTIFSFVAFGALFGAVGVILAAPLTVVCAVAVRRLWVPFMEGSQPVQAG